MGFLDKNNRIIDMVLTDYGREQYSKGELEFTYYAFSDDGVDYDPYISTSGSLTSVQLEEEKIDQIAATLIREAIFGHHKGENFESKDQTNIKNLLFTVPQGQIIVPEMIISPTIETGSLETKQQKVVERATTRDKDGNLINVINESDRGYRKFNSQKLKLDIEMEDYFEKASQEGYSIKIFESGSSGLTEIKSKRDNRNITSFSKDLQLYKDNEIKRIEKQQHTEIEKVVK